MNRKFFYGLTIICVLRAGQKHIFSFKIHFVQATHTALYLSQFLASLARQSEHKFSSRAEEEAAVVYNYDVFFTGWDISWSGSPPHLPSLAPMSEWVRDPDLSFLG